MVVTEGVTLMLELVAPLSQVNVVTPDAESVVELPAQTEVEFTLMLGEFVTIIVVVAMLAQPSTEIPVTV